MKKLSNFMKLIKNKELNKKEQKADRLSESNSYGNLHTDSCFYHSQSNLNESFREPIASGSQQFLDLSPNVDACNIYSLGNNLNSNEVTTSLNNNFKPGEEKEKTKNVYVINISNSKNFLLGSQKTINLPSKETSKTESVESDIGEALLNCEEVLNEDNITLIALNLTNEWKNFLKSLALGDAYLDELEFRNDNDKSLIVYDALQRYIQYYPKTSLGFIVSLLKKNNEMIVIQKLVEARRKISSGS